MSVVHVFPGQGLRSKSFQVVPAAELFERRLDFGVVCERRKSLFEPAFECCKLSVSWRQHAVMRQCLAKVLDGV